MTPAQQAGLKIGATYRVNTEKGEHSWPKGQLVTFLRDDSSSQPKFRRVGESRNGSDYAEDYVYTCNVELVTPALVEFKEVDVTIKHTQMTFNRLLTEEEKAAILVIVGA